MFAFDDKQTIFNLASWLANFLRILVLVTITILIHQIGHKILAIRRGTISECRIWGLQRFWFHTAGYIRLKIGKRTFKSIPMGVILPLLVILLSNGGMILPLIEGVHFSTKRKKPGYTFPNITNYELSKIALAGSFTNIFLIIILTIFNSSGIFSEFIFINATFALFNLLPIPPLDGGYAIFGSPVLYSFAIAFILAFLALTKVISLQLTIILAIIISIIAGITSYWFVVHKS